MTRISGMVLALAIGSGFAAHVCAQDSHKHHGAAPAKAGAIGAMTEGEVRKVDQAAGKITIKHGAMPKFDMPPMTMAYRAKDKAMLDQVKVGDKIKFDAEKSGSDFMVTRMEKAK